MLQENHRSIGQFKAKPIVVEAFQWHGGMFKKSFPPWFTKMLKTGEAKIYKKLGNPYIRINSALRVAYGGDWIVQGVNGQVYPVEPEVFEAMYDTRPIKRKFLRGFGERRRLDLYHPCTLYIACVSTHKGVGMAKIAWRFPGPQNLLYPQISSKRSSTMI